MAAALAGCLGTDPSDRPGSLSLEWVSDTSTEYEGNHHAMGVASIDGSPLICLPRNDLDGAETCGVVVLDADGTERWSDPIPPVECDPHAVGHIGTGDVDGDDQREFLVATEHGDVVAYEAATGDETFREKIAESSYSQPVVADITEEGVPELAIVDFTGTVSVVRGDGSIVWTRELGQPVFVPPVVADVTGDGRPNVAVHHGRRPSEVVCLDREGEPEWRTELGQPSLTWTYVDRGTEASIATADGNTVTLLRGEDGDQRWSTSIGDDLLEVRLGGAGEYLYVSAPDGAVRALDLDDGTIRWTAQTAAGTARMPSPALGSVTGERTTDVVAGSYDGSLAVFDGASGEPYVNQQLDVGLYTPPRMADLTGDGRDEILVLYGDARVGAYSYAADTG